VIRRLPLLLFFFVALSAGAQAPPTATQTGAPPTQAQLERKVEIFLRELFAWGPTFQVKVGPLSDAAVPGFYEVPVHVTVGEQTDTGTVYVSKDGRFLIRGEIHEVVADPFAQNRAHIHVDGNPSKGPSDARVTVVEFSDFQCPHCREFAKNLKEVAPKYPQVRFVFKDFPLTQTHPWAMTAALAARCVYMQSPEAFWTMHDSIFDNQDAITPENAWNKMLAFATQAGVQPDAFRACMVSPEAKQAVEANMAEAQALKVGSTPSIYINGRPLIGGPPEVLEQYITYELTAHPHELAAHPAHP